MKEDVSISKTRPHRARLDPTVALFDGLFLGKFQRKGLEILTLSSLKSSIGAIRLPDVYLWKFENYALFSITATSVIFSRFFFLTFDCNSPWARGRPFFEGRRDIFADKGSPWFFDQIYLGIEEKLGEHNFRLRFWTPEPYPSRAIPIPSLKICIRSWWWLNIIELDMFIYQMKALFL